MPACLTHRFPAREPQCGARRNGMPPGLVLIGGSTGAVPVIECMLAHLVPPCPPVVIAQHMPAHFLERLADRLRIQCQVPLFLLDVERDLQASTVYLAAGGGQTVELVPAVEAVRARRIPVGVGALNCPSIDTLFRSAAALPHAGDTLALLLSGMGRDGAEGMLALRQSGAETWVEDPETAAVDSMPRSAITIGAGPRIVKGIGMGHALNARLRTVSEPASR